MNYIPFLIKFTEGDKRLILAVVLVLLSILAIFILLAIIIAKIGRRQGKKVDELMHDVVFTQVAKDKKEFKKIARKKSNIYFYKHTRPAMLLIALHFIGCLIFLNYYPGATYRGIFTNYNTYGFSTLFTIYDLSNPTYTSFFGWFNIITNLEVKSTPHFTKDAIFAYIAVPTLFIGILLYLYQVQGLIARTLRINKLAKKIYSKDLEKVRVDTTNLENYKNTGISIIDDENKN